MPPESVTLFNFILALSPIIVVLILMVGRKWGGAQAGAAGWLTALIVAFLFFGAGPSLLAYSQMRALLFTLYVLYIIWMALVLYNTILEAGAIAAVSQAITRLAVDRVLQLLILSWVFSSFLQGIAGYGVPIAIVAPLLIGAGFAPVTAVAAVAIGHSWSVNFGSIAASFNTLIAATGIPGSVLAPWAAQLLGVACFACGIAAVWTYGGLAALRRGWLAILLIGSVMAGTQYVLAVAGLWNIAAFVAGLGGLGVAALVARLPFYRAGSAETRAPAVASAGSNPRKTPFLLAVTPYVILVAFVSVAELVEPVHKILNAVQIRMAFPATTTALGWVTKAGQGQSLSVFGQAGALLIYTSVLAFILFAVTGYYKPGTLKRILDNTARSAVRSSIGIAAMVGFALIMDQSGMTNLIAIGLSRALAPIYPFIAPFIGLLGAFMTGSNTNSNVLFAGLQQQTAQLLGLSAALILGAQTTGGSLGGMLAPARIIVGCSTAGLAGKEGQVLRRTMTYGIIITVLIGTIAWLASR
jgi:lactate permease